jgi:hypothetical protein
MRQVGSFHVFTTIAITLSLGAPASGNTAATSITETGAPGGDLTDGQPRASTPVSVFCVPPTFSGLVDPAAGLPGPGAVSLGGEAQLVP